MLDRSNASESFASSHGQKLKKFKYRLKTLWELKKRGIVDISILSEKNKQYIEDLEKSILFNDDLNLVEKV